MVKNPLIDSLASCCHFHHSKLNLPNSENPGTQILPNLDHAPKGEEGTSVIAPKPFPTSTYAL